MSLIDDQSAEIDAQLDRAWQKCRYGRKYSAAFEVALRIKTIREVLSGKSHSASDHLILLWDKIETVWSDIFEQAPEIDRKEAYDIYFSLRTAWILLVGAVSTSKTLRKVADALDAEPANDPRQVNIFKAYADCVNGRYPPTIVERDNCYVRCRLPTITQLRDAFVTSFGKKCWPGDFSVRKTLNLLGLELSKGKPGPPLGSRSLLRNRKP